MIKFQTILAAICFTLAAHAAPYDDGISEAEKIAENYKIRVCQSFNGGHIRSLEILGFNNLGNVMYDSVLRLTFMNGRSNDFEIYDSTKVHTYPSLSELNTFFGISKDVKFVSARKLVGAALNVNYIIATDEKGTQYLLDRYGREPRLVGASSCK